MPDADAEPEEPGNGLVTASHIFVLWGFAVAQPLYDLCGRNAELLVAHHARPVDLLLLVLCLSFFLPAVLWLFGAAVGRLHPGAAHYVVCGTVGLLAGLIVLPLLEEPGGLLALGAAAAAGVLAAAAYARLAAARVFLSFLAPSVVLFPAFFLLGSPVETLLFPRHESTPASARPEGDTPVFLVVFDEIPLVSLLDETGGIDAVRYPAFAELARTAHWFRNATTVGEATAHAVPSILTGRLPEKGELATSADQPDNLFTLLGGRELVVTETVTDLCPGRLCPETTTLRERFASLVGDLAVVYAHVVVPPPFAERLPSVSGGWGNFLRTGASRPGPAPSHLRQAMRADRKGIFEDFLDRIAPDAGGLHFLHLLLPHAPWDYLPSGKVYTVSWGPGPAVRRSDDDVLALHGHQRHLLQLGMVDRLLGALVGRLRENGLFDSSLLIVVADHGVSFRPGEPRRGIRPTTAGDILWVPFFVKLPGQTSGTVSERNVQTFDVLPTIADVLGVEIPFPVEGRSVFGTLADEHEEKIVYDHGKILRFDADSAPRERALRRKLARFGSRSRERLFRIGPAPHLHGRRVDDLPVRSGSEPSWELDDPSLFRDVDPTGDFVPALLTGHVDTGSPEKTLTFAVAVNGVVRATTKTFLRAGKQRFSVVVPEESFRKGRNHIDLLALR